MSQPRIVYDGDFSTVKQIGPLEYNLPFFTRGDSYTFEVIQKLSVDATAYETMPPMTGAVFKNHRGALTVVFLLEETPPTDAGCGRLEFTRVWGNIPATRSEYGNIVYAFQGLSNPSDPATRGVNEISLNLPCRTVFQYSTSLPSVESAPKVFVLNGLYFTIGGWNAPAAGTEVLAKDTEVQIYKAGIYVKQSVIVKIPTVSSYSVGP